MFLLYSIWNISIIVLVYGYSSYAVNGGLEVFILCVIISEDITIFKLHRLFKLVISDLEDFQQNHIQRFRSIYVEQAYISYFVVNEEIKNGKNRHFLRGIT